jgi:acyl carrier protein
VQTLEYLQSLMPELQIRSIESGASAFDWTVPDEWTIRDAYVSDESGTRVIDFKRHNLHVLNYSTPVDEWLSLEELRGDGPAPAVASTSAPSSSTAVADVVRQVLRLSSKADLAGAGIGLTPGWDSLRQIELILALEAALKIQFTSAELTELGSYRALATACQAKLEDLGPSTRG